MFWTLHLSVTPFLNLTNTAVIYKSQRLEDGESYSTTEQLKQTAANMPIKLN